MKNEPNGTYLIKLTNPFSLFSERNFEIDIISPKGGEIPIYHSDNTTSVVKSILKNKLFKI